MKLPNKAFDIEYSTQYRKEYLYLLNAGIQPTFIKHTKDFNVPVYKYKKTASLFAALSIFYDLEKNSKDYDSMLKAIESSDIKMDGNFGDTINFSDIRDTIDKDILSLTGGK